LNIQEGHPELIALIRDQIRGSGPVSFARFMEQALYHPEFGYYASDRAEIGRWGDYFTNVSVGPLFGRLLAAQLVEIWSMLRTTRDFWLVEQGAHHGELAADVLGAIRELSPDFFSAIRYCIVEPFGRLRDRQAQALLEFSDKIFWRDSVDKLEPFVGIYFCNELLDSFPVHLIVFQCGRGLSAPTSTGAKESVRGLLRRAVAFGEGGSAATQLPWLEKYVGFEDDQFVFIERPIANANLRAVAQALPIEIVGYTTEINLSALEWLDAISAKLTRGYLLVVDYGYTRDDFYTADRTAGTLQIRSKHRSLNSPFQLVGQADITAHVEWTSLAERAQERRLRLAGFTDQHHFLTGIISARPELMEQNHSKTARKLQTLLHPEMLGRSFQVLALARNVDRARTLSGFKFARDPHVALGV
jgi:SAM-dependent MidA family methyltransferase